MYTIFELSFNKKSRAIRLLYSVLHGDKSFLSNSIRNLINEKKIDIHWARNHKSSSLSSTHQSNDSSTVVVAEPQVQSQLNANSQSESTGERNSLIVNQTSETRSSNDASGLDPDVSVDANEGVTPS